MQKNKSEPKAKPKRTKSPRKPASDKMTLSAAAQVKAAQTAAAQIAAAQITTAEVINQGRSQFVRLPKGYRLKGGSVRISRAGDKVIIEPVRPPTFDLRAWLDEILTLDPADVLPDDDAAD